MSLSLQICFLLTQLLFIVCEISSTKSGNITFVPIDENSTSLYPQMIDPSAIKAYKRHKPNDNNTLLSAEITKHSKGNIVIFKSQANITVTKRHEIPVGEVSTNTTGTNTDMANARVNNTSFTVINSNLLSRLMTITSSISKIKDLRRALTVTDLEENNKMSTVLKLKRRKKFKVIYKSMPQINIVRRARSSENGQDNNSVLHPEGYIYDLNNCLYIDDRVLCGYNKNTEEPKKKAVVDLDDVCRKHGDRIECAYLKGPFPDVYNLDPENDQIANINLANYQNIARSGKHKMQDDNSDKILAQRYTSEEKQFSSNTDNDYDSDKILRTNDESNILRSEIFRLKNQVSKLMAALSTTANPSTTFTSTNNSIILVPKTRHINPDTTAPPIIVEVKKKPEPNMTLPKILKLKNEITKLTLQNIIHAEITTAANTNHIQPKRPNEECIEKAGRIFCPSV